VIKKVYFSKFVVFFLKIGRNHTCYYDGKNNIKSVKWNYNDKTFGYILFCIGYSIAAFNVPILVIILMFLIITRRHNEQKLIFNEIENSCNVLYRNDELLKNIL
jgi:hypothetical protein